MLYLINIEPFPTQKQRLLTCFFYFLLFTGFFVSNIPKIHANQKRLEEYPLNSTIKNLESNHPGLSAAYVLEKGEEALMARAWLADHAEKSINVQYFIWSTDNIGILASESLLTAAERGVRVRVIVDDLLIDAPSDSMLALTAHPNIEIKIYNPRHSVGVSQPERIVKLATGFKLSNQRMHDKTFMVDRCVAITGGRNMADEYFDYDHSYNFRDRDILLLGPVVVDMEKNFEDFWTCPLVFRVEELLENEQKRLSKERIAEIYEELHSYALDRENFAPEVREAINGLDDQFPSLTENLVWDKVRFISDVPEKNSSWGLSGGGVTTEALWDVVSKAEKSITIQSPYLVMPKGAIKFLGKLVRKGVKISISTNSLASTDNLQAFSGYSKQRKKILKAGIEVYEFKPDPKIQKDLIDRYDALEKEAPIFAIHAKTLVIDSKTLFIGTFNLDPRSTNLNTEVGVLINNSDLAKQVELSIKRDMLPANSWNAKAENPDQHASLGKRMKVRFWKFMPITKLL
ncbi:MAG: phospholipase D family protein [Proteobacteria bacterium]|nr:phospholipase D family protein [Pseudomonadota bacterium]MBU1736701.1 phospholipase D family protein [Pseudomonadota bacterium]